MLMTTIDQVRSDAESPHADAEALSTKVQEFYAKLRNKLEVHAYYQGN